MTNDNTYSDWCAGKCNLSYEECLKQRGENKLKDEEKIWAENEKRNLNGLFSLYSTRNMFSKQSERIASPHIIERRMGLFSNDN